MTKSLKRRNMRKKTRRLKDDKNFEKKKGGDK